MASRVDIVGLVAEVRRVRTGEPVCPARETLAELQIQIEGHASRDVRRPIGPIEPVREIETCNVRGSSSMPAGDGRFERQGTLYRARVGLQLDVGGHRVQRTV